MYSCYRVTFSLYNLIKLYSNCILEEKYIYSHAVADIHPHINSVSIKLHIVNEIYHPTKLLHVNYEIYYLRLHVNYENKLFKIPRNLTSMSQ